MARQASDYEAAIAELVVWYQADHNPVSASGRYSPQFSDFDMQIERQAKVFEELLLDNDVVEPGTEISAFVN